MLKREPIFAWLTVLVPSPLVPFRHFFVLQLPHTEAG